MIKEKLNSKQNDPLCSCWKSFFLVLLSYCTCAKKKSFWLKEILKNRCVEPVLSLLFPPICLHCGQTVSRGGNLFCAACVMHFELLDPKGRCIYCFQEWRGGKACSKCVKSRGWSCYIAAPLCQEGGLENGVGSLLTHLQQGRIPFLVNTAVSWMVLELDLLQWPEMDFIIVQPEVGLTPFSQNALRKALAKRLGKVLNVPFKAPFWSAYFLEKGIEVLWKRGVKRDAFFEKKILLITDLVEEESLRKSAKLLLKEGAREVFALGVSLKRS